MQVYLIVLRQVSKHSLNSHKFHILVSYTSPTMKSWFSDMTEVALRCKEILSLWVFDSIQSALFAFLFKVMDRLLFAALTCILALGGSIMGTIAGAIKGQTTEVGILDGAGKGAITGAIAALKLLEFVPGDEPFSKVALLGSLLNGKIFMEWVCPAVAHAYLLHFSTPEATYSEASDTYDIMGVPGLSKKIIQKLPLHQFDSNTMLKLYNESCCSICFQDFKDRELVRILPRCGHLFHMECIDKWLIQRGSCPMCRTCVTDQIHEL